MQYNSRRGLCHVIGVKPSGLKPPTEEGTLVYVGFLHSPQDKRVLYWTDSQYKQCIHHYTNDGIALTLDREEICSYFSQARDTTLSLCHPIITQHDLLVLDWVGFHEVPLVWV